jgi:xanthine/CO dehydrogenase XdhC/CoxF family maturation factor
VGVLQRFERRLEGMVEGTFARVFKSELQPVEVASAVQHEMDERAAIVAQGRTLVPNDFVVEIGQTDASRLDIYAESLSLELATLARDHATEQGYSFVGPVRIRFEGVPDLSTGVFRIRSGVIRGHTVEAGEVRQPVSDLPRVAGQYPGRPRLVVSGSQPGTGVEAGSTYELHTPVTLLGRGTDCDLRLVDPGVSRHHAELRIEDGQVVLVDRGSTNGTIVNGQPVRRFVLIDGTTITLGRTTMVFRQDGRYDGKY